MKIFEGKTEAERRKLIIVMIAAPLALIAVLYNFGAFSGKKKRAQTAGVNSNKRPTAGDPRIKPEDVRALEPPSPIVYTPAVYAPPQIAAIGRNIFGYSAYTNASTAPRANTSVVTATPEFVEPTPAPMPPAPLVLASVSPSNVYARTGNFPLQLSGDKFTAETRIYLNNQELPTEYVSPQLVKANVPAALIASEGARSVVVRTPDNTLYSNQMTLSVMPPPAPQYNYVGLVSSRQKDTVVLKARNASPNNNELLNVQRGEIVGGRFRLTNISERSIELTDRELNVKHTLPFVDSRTTANNNPNQGNSFNNQSRFAQQQQLQQQRLQQQQQQQQMEEEEDFEEEQVDDEPDESPPRKP